MHKILGLFLFLYQYSLVQDFPASSQSCGYSSCNPVKEGMLNVHLVCHTHDDPGWKETVDQYYYHEIQYILNSVVTELLKHPRRRFTYVEMAFFARWFREQDDDMKNKVRQLVNEGRLEITLGGWTMNDEAATHYSAIIDQHALGFDFVRQNLGECGRPRVGWQIDPFGHSREQASLFAQFGFDSLFFGRLDYQDKANRLNTNTMEMIWRGSPHNLGSRADLFTGVLPNGYDPPKGFCFDMTWYCRDEPIKDDPRLNDYNADQKVDSFIQAVTEQAKHYNTNHTIVTMGTDFLYHAAHMWYLNIDKLIKHVNARQANGSRVNLLYSTPACYTYHVHQTGLAWPTKEDDFFPYAHRPHGFWTGYFTSRPALKLQSRRANHFLQVVKQLDALTLMEENTDDIRMLAEAVGLIQHHDGISGTENQAVADDYAQRLARGTDHGEKVANTAFKKLLSSDPAAGPDVVFCSQLNVSVCNVTETADQFQVIAYNPFGREVQWNVRMPVTDYTLYNVTGPDGTAVQSDLYDVPSITWRIPERGILRSGTELVFPVTLPPLGYNVYFVSKSPTQPQDQKSQAIPSRLFAGSDETISGKYVSLTFDGTTGLLKSMTNLEHSLTVPVSQTYLYYEGFPGDNRADDRLASGAYMFRPQHQDPRDLTRANLTLRCYISHGQLVQEVYQEFNEWMAQVVRVYQDQRYAEFEWTVGPIPVDDGGGKEVISRFSTSLRNHEVFYTDANGREMMERRLDHRETWHFEQTEPVSGNYYPVNSRIFIKDEDKQIQFTVLTDRSQGGSSLHEGELELMIHRRLLLDDNLGVIEPLNEPGTNGQGLMVRGSHYVTLEPITKAASVHRELAQRLYWAPQVAFTPFSGTRGEWVQQNNHTWSGLKQALPPNVHLLTMEQFPVNGPVSSHTQPLLVRLEHFYEKGENALLSQPANVSLRDLFSPFQIMSATELTLGANLPLSDLSRLKWQAQGQTQAPADGHVPISLGHDMTVTLNPMEIRTFQITTDTAVPSRDQNGRGQGVI